MVKTNQNATVYAGNRKVLRFTVVDEDNSNDPLDLTAYKVYFAMAKIGASSPRTADPLIDMNSVDDSTQVVKTDPTNGVVDVILLAADTDLVKPDDYYIELEGEDPSGNTEVFAVGTLKIEPNVDNA